MQTYQKRLFFYFILDDETKWTDPKVIQLYDNSDPEDDLDYIPPSPIPDEISCTTSALETRSVLSICYLF